ncbi:hypothetical protein GCM10027040_29930 [Halomonas shantousis]
MNTELDDFEKLMQREINTFLKPKSNKETTSSNITKPSAEKNSPRESAASYKTGHVIKLAVRKNRLGPDVAFEHRSSSISKLEAQLEAEKAARKAGYPIVGYVIDIQRL